jgi:hypothetical protein
MYPLRKKITVFYLVIWPSKKWGLYGQSVGLGNINFEMHAQSSSGVVVCCVAGRAQQAVVLITADKQSFPACPSNCWMSQFVR